MSRLGWVVIPVVGLATVLPLTACGGGGIDAASPAAFCTTLKQQRSDPDELWTGLGAVPAYSNSMRSTQVVTLLSRVTGLMHRLDQEAPAAVKPAMNTLTAYFQVIVSDYQHHGTTEGQVVAYMRQHPPTVKGAAAAEQTLGHFTSKTCHISE